MSKDLWGVVTTTAGSSITYVGGVYTFKSKVRVIDSDVAGNLVVHLIGDEPNIWTTIRVRAEVSNTYQFDQIKDTSTLVLANVLFGH
jgi:hypothetical protein